MYVYKVKLFLSTKSNYHSTRQKVYCWSKNYNYNFISDEVSLSVYPLYIFSLIFTKFCSSEERTEKDAKFEKVIAYIE